MRTRLRARARALIGRHLRPFVRIVGQVRFQLSGREKRLRLQPGRLIGCDRNRVQTFVYSDQIANSIGCPL